MKKERERREEKTSPELQRGHKVWSVEVEAKARSQDLEEKEREPAHHTTEISYVNKQITSKQITSLKKFLCTKICIVSNTHCPVFFSLEQLVLVEDVSPTFLSVPLPPLLLRTTPDPAAAGQDPLSTSLSLLSLRLSLPSSSPHPPLSLSFSPAQSQLVLVRWR